MTRSRTQSLILGGTALGALYLVGFALIASAWFTGAPDRIAFGVALDLTLTALLIVWWLDVRKSELPGWAALAAFSWGLFVARLWASHAPIQMLVAVGGVAELVTIGWLLLRVRRLVQTARAARHQSRRS